MQAVRATKEELMQEEKRKKEATDHAAKIRELDKKLEKVVQAALEINFSPK